jgi:hypothetical protein
MEKNFGKGGKEQWVKKENGQKNEEGIRVTEDQMLELTRSGHKDEDGEIQQQHQAN